MNANINVGVGTPSTKKYHSYRTARIISTVISYILLVILALIWLYPICWIIISAFRVDITSAPSTYLPSHFSSLGFDNFKHLWTNGYNTLENGGKGIIIYFPQWFANTLLVSVFSCVISTVCTLAVAYVMSKLSFSWRKSYLNIAMVIGLFPGFMSMIAIYYILKTFHMTGSLFSLIVCYSAGAGTGFYIAKGFFDVIPDALVESAKLDGATNAQIFFKIILPISKPIVIYQALMAFTGPWMDFIFAKVILGPDNRKAWTVSVGLYNMLYGPQADPTIFGIFAAGCVCVGVPIVTLFMCLQRYYIEGVTAGSVK